MSRQREAEARSALTILGVDRFLAFVRAIRPNSAVTAVDLSNEELDAGAKVEDLFFTGEDFGYMLTVTRRGKKRFKIDFGCQAAPLAGDGGEWIARFNEEGQVIEIIGGVLWMS